MGGCGSDTKVPPPRPRLFLRGQSDKQAKEVQLQLDLGLPEVESFHQRWQLDAERERVNRTRFAQRELKPAEVRLELEATNAVLGDPDAIRDFVLGAGQHFGLNIKKEPRADVFRMPVGPDWRASMPAVISFALPASQAVHWLFSFTSPTPEGAEYLGRNHRFVVALAQFLMEEALKNPAARKPPAAA